MAHDLNKIPRTVLDACANLEMSDEEIKHASPQELFGKLLEWEGIHGYTHKFWSAAEGLLKLKVRR
jgi:hypothetical protein